MESARETRRPGCGLWLVITEPALNAGCGGDHSRRDGGILRAWIRAGVGVGVGDRLRSGGGDVQAGGDEAGAGLTDGQADDGRHDVADAGRSVFVIGDQDGDARAIKAGAVGRRRLGEDGAGGSGAGEMGVSPSSSWRRLSMSSAGCWSWPVTSGTGTCCWPSDSVTRICQPRRTRAPGTGDCESTWLAPMVGA